jgi:hypothetical protein
MKYLITESKFNDTIKNFILESYPFVQTVEFKPLKVVLGSSKGSPIIDSTIIRILINNSENEYDFSELKKISNQMRNTIDGMFNLNSREYGSGYDFEFQQVAVVSLEATLKRNPIK